MNKIDWTISTLLFGLLISSCSDAKHSSLEIRDGGPNGANATLDGAAGTASGSGGEYASRSGGGIVEKGGAGAISDVGGAIRGTDAVTGGSGAGGFKAGGAGGTTYKGGAGGSGGTSGAGGTGGTFTCACVKSGTPVCTATGKVTYALARSSSPTAKEQAAYDAISCAMNMATAYYNCYTNITKSLNVSYLPSVATADGNINGSIRFGSTESMNCITAMHEVAHTVGVGTAGNWSSLVSNGTFTGANATKQLRTLNGNQSDVLHADSQHFWPYGLNYISEVSSTADLVNHCSIVVAIRQDLGM